MLSPTIQIKHSVCPHDCPSVCDLRVEVDGTGNIGRVKGGDQAYTDGVICAKVARYAERVHHPDRLTHPLRRIGPKGSGQFEAITWEKAFDLLVEQIRLATKKYGPESIWPYHYAGTMGLIQRGAIRRLGNLAGWSQQRETFCVATSDTGWIAGTGSKKGVDAREMVDSDLIVIWGGNPVHTQINMMHWVSKARRDRAVPLVVIDPYRTATAAKADLHLALRPGTDGALACAVMHVLLEEGYADSKYLAQYTDFSDLTAAHLKSRTPQWAAAITGLTEKEIIDFAHLYGKNKKSYIRLGFGFTRHRNGSAAMHAVSCLPAITGSWQYRGGGALYYHGAIYKLNTRRLFGLDTAPPPARYLDMGRIGAVLNQHPRDIQDGPPVAVMLIQSTNPAVVTPETKLVHQGLLREDLFVCVHEQFMTETATLADLVLPATMFLEHDDVYQASGHTFLQASQAIIPVPGQCKSNHTFISELAQRLDIDHPFFALTDAQAVAELLSDSDKPSAEEIIQGNGLDCALDFADAHYLNGFDHPDGKFRFSPKWSEISDHFQEMPHFPDHHNIQNHRDAEHPFRLVAAPARHFLNTTFTETPSSQKGEKQPHAVLHQLTCERLGLQNGDLVRVGNHLGSILLPIQSVEGLHEDTVVIESQWPNHAFIEGVGVNSLVSAEPALPNAGVAYHDTAVWIRPEHAQP